MLLSSIDRFSFCRLISRGIRLPYTIQKFHTKFQQKLRTNPHTKWHRNLWIFECKIWTNFVCTLVLVISSDAPPHPRGAIHTPRVGNLSVQTRFRIGTGHVGREHRFGRYLVTLNPLRVGLRSVCLKYCKNPIGLRLFNIGWIGFHLSKTRKVSVGSLIK